MFASVMWLCERVQTHASPFERQFMSEEVIEYISQVIHSLHKRNTLLSEFVLSLSWILSCFYILSLLQQNQKLGNNKHKKLSAHAIIK